MNGVLKRLVLLWICSISRSLIMVSDYLANLNRARPTATSTIIVRPWGRPTRNLLLQHGVTPSQDLVRLFKHLVSVAEVRIGMLDMLADSATIAWFLAWFANANLIFRLERVTWSTATWSRWQRLRTSCQLLLGPVLASRIGSLSRLPERLVARYHPLGVIVIGVDLHCLSVCLYT